jgi:hypothetical protein
MAQQETQPPQKAWLIYHFVGGAEQSLRHHHQPEAQHPKSSAIHKLDRPITSSFAVISFRQFVHAYTPRAVRQAIEAGVKCILHGHTPRMVILLGSVAEGEKHDPPEKGALN